MKLQHGCVAIVLFIVMCPLAKAAVPTPAEMQEAKRWMAARFEGIPKAKSGRSFFSFTYGGQPSSDLLDTWQLKRTTRELDEHRTEHTLTYTDPKTGLLLRCVGVEYNDFPVVEWTLYFKNTGDKNTPMLQGIQALDVRMKKPEGDEFVLRGCKGDDCNPMSYEPYAEMLGPSAKKAFAAVRGRPTQITFPYYNLQMPGGGLIVVVGWPGQWASSFTRDAAKGLQITAGQELTHLYLKPGEEIRTPLMVLMFWKGSDTVRSQNLWRRWMMAHNTPKLRGEPFHPILTYCDGGFVPGLKTSESVEKLFIDMLAREKVKLDYWWIDAGWYPCKNDWTNTGSWQPDPERYPKGIKAVSDYVHARKTGLIVWFEPERVTSDTWLTKNHPEWISGGKQGGLLNLGNKDAWNWLVNHVDRLITQQGIDFYRQDFNYDPLDAWRSHDAVDRQGMTENLHVQGYLAYWDELQRRHPGMPIDSCASGGRRNDLETLRRAVPLLRSDYQPSDMPSTAGNQGHTYGLSSWIPYHGQGVYYQPQNFVYCVRSYMCPAFAIVTDVRKNEMDWNLYRRLVAQWREVANCMLGDFYPLLPYNLDEGRWIAWQFDRPESGDGMVQAFRRPESPYESIRVKLHGLEPSAIYEITNLDAATLKQISGKELLEQGLLIDIGVKPGAVIIKYHKL
jgi:alpha-galactosidase